MAPFSFRAGNAAKILRAPLYALGRLVTAVVPRTDAWAFGCGAGVGDGPLEVWRIARREGVDAVWIAASEAERREAEERGMPAVLRDSWRGFWATARARVVVVAFGLGDASPYGLSGALVVQLWHGIPLKRIGLDSPETTRSPLPIGRAPISALLALAYRASADRISILPASSRLTRGRLESAFGLPYGRVRITGEPRVDPLSTGDADERRERARTAIESAVGGMPDGARLVLYAPTWRDGAADPAVPTSLEWHAIRGVLERRNAVLLIRSHRLGAGDYAPPFESERIRHIGSDRLRDITPALSGLDVLVTDYSSLAFDAGLVPLPVVFLAPDAESYAARRGFYGRYTDLAGPDFARDWPAAAAQLEAVLGDESERDTRIARSAAVSARVHAYRDGENAQRVFDAVRAELGSGSRGPERDRGAMRRRNARREGLGGGEGKCHG